jgi:hypothetical protein
MGDGAAVSCGCDRGGAHARARRGAVSPASSSVTPLTTTSRKTAPKPNNLDTTFRDEFAFLFGYAVWELNFGRRGELKTRFKVFDQPSHVPYTSEF